MFSNVGFLRFCLLSSVFGYSIHASSSSLYDIVKTNEDGLVDYAEDSYELRDISDFYQRVFGDDYETNWNELNKYKSGSVASQRVPYLDSWYPEKSGGTNVNIAPSSWTEQDNGTKPNWAIVNSDDEFINQPSVMGALDKYDKAFFGAKSTAAKWERDNHTRKTPDWYGHCNGTSAAVARFQNPEKSVYRPKDCTPGSKYCTKFTPRDIRALLSEIAMNAKAKFISGNRCSKTKDEIEDSPRRLNSLAMDSCQDINPASFHIALVNFIRKQGQTLIFDKSQDKEVWNYPLYSYDYSAEKVSISKALSVVGVSKSSWIFNPAAKDFVSVTMNVDYRNPSTRNFNYVGSKTRNKKTLTYKYILELDANDNIIGGEWSKENYSSHPDFLWMPFEPAVATGDRGRGNPMISNENVISIWAESMGFSESDPFRNQPKDIAYDIRFYPEDSEDWGHNTGYYQVLLNGINAAYVFREEPTEVTIDAGSKIKDGVTFRAYLNGKSVALETIRNGKARFTISPPEGLSELKFVWSTSDIPTTSLNWTYTIFGE